MTAPTYLTLHFTLDELTDSQVAARTGLDNRPPADARANLVRLATTLEHVRAILGCPVIISSGYRCPALNTAIGGSTTSAHLRGLAADFTVPMYGPPLKIARVLAASDLPFDQLIQEGGHWVHLGLPHVGEIARRQLLTAVFTKGGTVYKDGLYEM